MYQVAIKLKSSASSSRSAVIYEQELNIEYVAITRAKKELYFVGGLPTNLHFPEEKTDVDALLASFMSEPPDSLETVMTESDLPYKPTYIEEQSQEASVARRGRPAGTSGKSEPTKKKDFRFPIWLLQALKAAADESGMNDTEFVIELLNAAITLQQHLHQEEILKCQIS